MEDPETLIEEDFPLFSNSFSSKKPQNPPPPPPPPPQSQNPSLVSKPPNPTESTESDSGSLTFSDLGLAEWAVQTCAALGMKKPTPVQRHCIPRILAGADVLGLAQTGSGKTAAFALPILHRLSENPYGVFALVVTPTRELAYQLAEQFRALGSSLHLRCTVVVGGMHMINQAQVLAQRPHVVIATPGRLKVLLEDNPDLSSVFSRAKFLVLDEADRVLDVGFEAELRVIFQYLPKDRQTLLFSATMTNNLQALHQLSANRAYFYEAYEGFKTVDTLKQQYVFIHKNVKDVYLLHILSQMEDLGIRSAIVFASRCRYPRDYVHRVGRTARAGRGGLAVSFVTENDVHLVRAIEAEIGKQLDEFECKENEVLADITKVFKAKRIATMKMIDDGYEEKAKERKSQKMKTLAEKGLLKRKRKNKKL